jgi:hypothetical protein
MTMIPGPSVYDLRVKYLSRQNKAALASIWRTTAGRNDIYLAAPVARWSKDEIISDILDYEYPGRYVNPPADDRRAETGFGYGP